MEMHYFRSANPASFRSSYASNVKKASDLVEQADFDGYSLRHGEDPSSLHFAAGCGCLEVCAQLLRRCGRLNFTTDCSGQTPLFWAVQSGLRSTVNLLLQHGADAVHKDNQGQTPLHICAAKCFPQTCSLLLATCSVQSFGLELRSCRDLSPLHVAARHGHTEVIDCLLAATADPSAVTLQGRTPLHLAAMAGHSGAVERLLEAAGPLAEPRALFELADVEGMRALDYALERGLPEAALVLSGEESAQERIRLQWKRRFEPPCRANLNVSMCNAWLEISRPEILAVHRFSLHLECRIVDALGLVEGYTVEVLQSVHGGHINEDQDSCDSAASVSFARGPKQKPIDNVEFRLPRRSEGKSVWAPGAHYAFRVVGVVAPHLALQAGYPLSTIRSPWTIPTWLPAGSAVGGRTSKNR